MSNFSGLIYLLLSIIFGITSNGFLKSSMVLQLLFQQFFV